MNVKHHSIAVFTLALLLQPPPWRVDCCHVVRSVVVVQPHRLAVEAVSTILVDVRHAVRVVIIAVTLFAAQRQPVLADNAVVARGPEDGIFRVVVYNCLGVHLGRGLACMTSQRSRTSAFYVGNRQPAVTPRKDSAVDGAKVFGGKLDPIV